MKDRIVDESINSLKKEGLKFSVDMLAERLKVSKKTIYKYFPDKEALAYAMYEKYYAVLNDKIDGVIRSDDDSRNLKLLEYYFDSAGMVRPKIFNKYSLNGVIGEQAKKCHSDVWQKIKPLLCAEMTEEDADIFRLIVDSAAEKAEESDTETKNIVRMLMKLL
ncbi:MAG: TetR/AcrR family transcriptional regulator [Clostridia bacterium]|nr:TetR/AcrR family transcriptional regulator [Clostridia bacterium]